MIWDLGQIVERSGQMVWDFGKIVAAYGNVSIDGSGIVGEGLRSVRGKSRYAKRSFLFVKKTS